MQKRNIGFFSGGSDYEYNGKIVDGILQACIDEDFTLFGFTSLMNKLPEWCNDIISDAIISGETQVFDLADYSKLDGVIILGDQFVDDNVQNQIIERALSYDIPVVIIDGQHENCYSVQFCDNLGMENMVRHIVENHKKTKINFISGYEGNRQSEERLNSYKKVLEEHNIPFEKERVGYGMFGGYTDVAMKKFLNSDLEFPEAIICANDMMALEAILFLNSIGKTVPDDVIVTGFDGIMLGQTFCPAITSVRRPIYEAGYGSVEILKRIWNNEKVDEITHMDSILIKNQSCGCRKMTKADVGQYFRLQKEIADNYDRFNYNLVNLTNEMSSASSVMEIFDDVRKNSSLFDVNNTYFCMNDKIIAHSDEFNFSLSDNEKGYTEIMTAYYVEEDMVKTERFPSWQLIPDICKNRDSKKYTYFLPMYFQNKTLGYVIMTVDSYEKNSYLFYTWIRTISNAIGDFYMMNEMEFMMHKLEYMSVRDPLTLLYNRRGLIKDSELLLEKTRSSERFIYGIGIDLDGLKIINDSYGHDEGDNAIVQVANALRYAKRGNAICSRTGGDEFFIFGTDENEKIGNDITEKIAEFLSDYNQNSNKPYKVDCSCGVYTAPAGKVKTFESVMKLADQVMYTVKSNKKAAKRLLK